MEPVSLRIMRLWVFSSAARKVEVAAKMAAAFSLTGHGCDAGVGQVHQPWMAGLRPWALPRNSGQLWLPWQQSITPIFPMY